MSIRLMTMVWDVEFPTQSQKLIALKLADYAADAGGSVFPAVNTIARHAGCDERTVQRALKAFRACGFLHLVKEGGTGPKATNQWQIDIPALAALAAGRSRFVGTASELEIEEIHMGDILSDMGDNLSASDALRVTNEGLRVTPVSAKGDTGVTQSFTNHQIEPSLGAGARASLCAARPSPEEERLILCTDRTWKVWINWLRQSGHTSAAAVFEKEGGMIAFSERPFEGVKLPILPPLPDKPSYLALLAKRPQIRNPAGADA